MSYLVLARKSRPQTFAEVVGQEAIVRTLQNALTQSRVAHALMFSGIRGTGKTTLARIMAKALNCEQGPAAEPCNTCRSCLEIIGGTSVDIQEVDGASNRGIQEIRELKEKIRFMPTSSRFKIIIIDEVHMLTTEAFNALLKTLEEPPNHVYFMFATTELHKVPVTILSRCQRYELKRLGDRELADHFNRLAEQEGVRMEPEAMSMIVREADGSVRDGLSLLDQVFSYCGQEVRALDVVEVLGVVSHQLVANLGAALLKGDLASVYALLDEMYVHGSDIKRFGNDLLTWFRSIVVCKISQTPGKLLDLAEEELARVQENADAHSLETLSAMFNLVLEGLEKASFSQQPRLALELAFIRAAQFRDVVPVTELISRFDQMLAGQPLDALPFAVPPPSSRHHAERLPAQSIEVASQSQSQSQHAAPVESPTEILSSPLPTPPPEPPLPPQPETVVVNPVSPMPIQETSAAETASGSVLAGQSASVVSPESAKKRIRKNWDAFLKYIREQQRQPWIAAALEKATAVERKEDELCIRFADSIDCTLLKQHNNVNALAEFVLDFFQENLHIRFEAPGTQACALDGDKGDAPLQERRALAHDPLVLTALDVFTGQVGEIRIGRQYRQSSSATVQPAVNKQATAEQ